MIRYYFFFIFAVFIASFSQVFLKKSSMIKYRNFIRSYLNAYVIIGYGLLFLSLLLATYLYQFINLKVGPVLESLSYLFVFLLSRIFFKEILTQKRVLGLCIIIIGIIIFNL